MRKHWKGRILFMIEMLKILSRSFDSSKLIIQFVEYVPANPSDALVVAFLPQPLRRRLRHLALPFCLIAWLPKGPSSYVASHFRSCTLQSSLPWDTVSMSLWDGDFLDNGGGRDHNLQYLTHVILAGTLWFRYQSNKLMVANDWSLMQRPQSTNPLGEVATVLWHVRDSDTIDLRRDRSKTRQPCLTSLV